MVGPSYSNYGRLSREERIIKEYNILTKRFPYKLDGNIVITNKRIIYYEREVSVASGTYAYTKEADINQIYGTRVINEKRIIPQVVMGACMLIIIGIFALTNATTTYEECSGPWWNQTCETVTKVNESLRSVGVLLILLGVGVGFLSYKKIIRIEVLLGKLDSMFFGADIKKLQVFGIKPGRDIEECSRELFASVLAAQKGGGE